MCIRDRSGAYLEDVEGKALWETFDFVSSEMPEDDPGSLRPEEYAAVLAYIFSVYGQPSGDAELATDQESLEAITIASSLPNSTARLVRLVTAAISFGVRETQPLPMA